MTKAQRKVALQSAIHAGAIDNLITLKRYIKDLEDAIINNHMHVALAQVNCVKLRAEAMRYGVERLANAQSAAVRLARQDGV